MSKFRNRLVVWASGAVLAIALGMPGIAAAQIKNTKHNLTSTGPGSNVNSQTGTDQICVFCHTPHGSETGVAAPLWNKALPTTATSYKTYNSTSNGGAFDSTNATSTIDGVILSVGSVSLACLSCHDGTQAMDNMVNTPGSGSPTFVPGWSGGNQSGGKLNVSGLMSNLGIDLNNDHPIGIQYCGGGVSGTAADGNAVPASTIDCKDDDFVKNIKNAKIGGNQVFWVERDGTDTKRGKADIILYTRDFGTAGGGVGPSVECGSCHDPHAQQTDTNSVHFMRVTTSGSQICLACHVK
jgi:hypothetical protein